MVCFVVCFVLSIKLNFMSTTCTTTFPTTLHPSYSLSSPTTVEIVTHRQSPIPGHNFIDGPNRLSDTLKFLTRRHPVRYGHLFVSSRLLTYDKFYVHCCRHRYLFECLMIFLLQCDTFVRMRRSITRSCCGTAGST